MLLSDTADKAAEFLDHIKYELVNNARLAEAYPDTCERGGRYPRAPRWRANEIITANGIKVAAQGVSQNIRGRRHVETRPDLIIVDDAETRENTQTAEARAKLDEWFNKSVLKAGSKETRVLNDRAQSCNELRIAAPRGLKPAARYGRRIAHCHLVVGTIQHYDSLLARLTNRVKSPLWEGRVYRQVVRVHSKTLSPTLSLGKGEGDSGRPMNWSGRPELWESWSEC